MGIIRQHSVTIGIPAYNEAANLPHLLERLLKMKLVNLKVEKIIVVSDASSDNTDEIVTNVGKSFRHVILQRNKVRKGQIYSQNQLLKNCKSDILVILEADTLPENKFFIENLCRPLLIGTTAVTQGQPIPVATKNLISKALGDQAKTYISIIDKIGFQNFASGRAGRAILKKAVGNFFWPSNVPEDVFLQLWCQKQKLNYQKVTNAKSKYCVPGNYTDYLREVHKIQRGQKTLYKWFSHKLLEKNVNLIWYIKALMALILLLRSPISFGVFVYLKIFAFNKPEQSRFKDVYTITRTTKLVPN